MLQPHIPRDHAAHPAAQASTSDASTQIPDTETRSPFSRHAISAFEGLWEWSLTWPKEGQQFLMLLLPGGGLIQCSHHLMVQTGLGRWEQQSDERCAWEFYALVASEEVPDLYGGRWHLWGDLVLSSRHFAGSQSTKIEIHNAQGNLVVQQECVALSARRLFFDQIPSHSI